MAVKSEADTRGVPEFTSTEKKQEPRNRFSKEYDLYAAGTDPSGDGAGLRRSQQ